MGAVDGRCGKDRALRCEHIDSTHIRAYSQSNRMCCTCPPAFRDTAAAQLPQGTAEMPNTPAVQKS